jgi:hypothetical protein
LKLGKKSTKTESYVGKTAKELMSYLLSVSTDSNITADNYGTYWWVDHIVPVSHFDHSDDEQVKRCWHFSNLQPLEKIANIRKGNKLLAKVSGE